MRRAELFLLLAGIALLLPGCSGGETEPSAEPIFSDEPIWSSGTQTSGGDGIARFVDVDRDGDLDFVTSAPEPRRWVSYRNESGTIAAEPFWQSHETTDCDHIDVLDFNQDGWMDLAGTHESYCTLYFNHSGEFNQAPDWETGLIANANQIDFGDFDQDGDLDMVMAAGEPIDGVALFVNESGTPDRQVSAKLGHEEYSESAIFADSDGDGDLDITAAYRGGKIVLFENSNGEFDGGTTIFEDLESPWTQRLYWRDLDGDGAMELFCAKGPWRDELGTSVQLVLQEGGATAEVRWQSSPDTAFHAFEFADVDGDGDLDVIASDYAHGGSVALYLNSAEGLASEPAWSVGTSGPAHEAVFGDIDQDGDLDLAVGCRDQAHVFENQLADGD
ncbi:MAG: VCBS repeat-containing protein [Bryobacterales bacterium]|nr:VCBS repeat-containing protein [Bryobacterales bacterium]MDE0262420.1 VCBS repeat-containing protein [Bryobacterales bacterium]MDE0621513.1 VCBS repeat-containing protein [Bryobacterales bacterium]